MDSFSELLQRYRACKGERHQGRADKTNATPSKRKAAPFSAPSKTIATWANKWAENASAERANDTRGANDVASSHPTAPQATSSSITFAGPRSAFVPCPGSLPPLLQGTIGYLPQTECCADASPTQASTCPRRCAAGSSAFSCVVVDLETTGFVPDTSEIIEVGFVELRWNPPSLHPTPAVMLAPEGPSFTSAAPFLATCSGSETKGSHGDLLSSFTTCSTVSDGFWTRGARCFHRYVRPSSRAAITAASTAVHGITWDKVKDCDEWPVVAKELARFLHQISVNDDPLLPSPQSATSSMRSPGGDGVVRCTQSLVVQLPPLVAHNASFDASFLERHLQRCGYYVVWDAHYPLTCSMKWARKAYPHVAPNLNSICEFLGIEGVGERAAGFHGAMTDAVLTAKLFLQLCRRWEEHYNLNNAVLGSTATR
jgi:DNA polymerase III epsilon subunit-like protein